MTDWLTVELFITLTRSFQSWALKYVWIENFEYLTFSYSFGFAPWTVISSNFLLFHQITIFIKFFRLKRISLSNLNSRIERLCCSPRSNSHEFIEPKSEKVHAFRCHVYHLWVSIEKVLAVKKRRLKYWILLKYRMPSFVRLLNCFNNYNKVNSKQK